MTGYVVALALGLLMSIPLAGVAEGSGAEAQDGVQWHHGMRARAMSDMARIMGEMSTRMSGATLQPGERAAMVRRMKRMSEMMRLMSDWEADLRMGQAEMKEPMIRMRREMDHMLQEMNVASPEGKQGK